MLNWMNILLRRIVRRTRREMRILMLGLDGAGKTTILRRLKIETDEIDAAVPTVGFNVEAVVHKNIKCNVWDVCGQRESRSLWPFFYNGIQGLIFVVDANDNRRIKEARNALDLLLRADELRGRPLLVLANKQDLPYAMSPAQLTDELGLRTLRHRKWHIQGSCMANKVGLYKGLRWLAKAFFARGPFRSQTKLQPCPALATNDEHCEIARQILDSLAGRGSGGFRSSSDSEHVDLTFKAMAKVDQADFAKEVQMTKKVLKSWTRRTDKKDQKEKKGSGENP